MVGVDNNRISAYLTPPLSTVNQPKYTMGSLLAGKFIDQLTHNDFTQQQVFQVAGDLIIRESSIRRA
ncbi:transcriptional repressor RbsR [compost metagenome]